MTRTEIQERITSAKADLELTRQAMRDIMSGKKQSYGIGTRNASAYSMSIPQLEQREKTLLREIADLEKQMLGQSRRARIAFRPIF